MQVNKNENEIVIKINKDEYEYRVLANRKDISDDIANAIYCLSILTGVGFEGEVEMYEPTKIMKSKYEKMDSSEIKKEVCKLHSYVDESVSMLANEIKEDSFVSPDGLIAIDSANTVGLLKLYLSRIKLINDELLRREMTNEC